MAMLRRECPWCTVILVTLCMLCHVTVLVGNLKTASAVEDMGRSAAGWSDVGLGMATGFKTEIDDAMSNITQQLTDAIQQIVAIEEMMDVAIGKVGNNTEATLLQMSLLTRKPDDDSDFPVALPDDLKDVVDSVKEAQKSGKLPATLEKVVPKVLAQIGDGLDRFLDFVEPALLKVGDWETSFGDKVQAGIEEFSTTIDIVQKMFDQIMAQSSPPSDDPDIFKYMMQNTYTLFAISNASVGITVQDLQDVSMIYSITALQGSKAEDLFARHDTNKDAVVDQTEFAGFVMDESVPSVMAVVLRAYAKRLSQVAGKVAAAKLRDEVAFSVVKYLQLVCAKNITKVGWISDMLTNGTLPLAFTADIMRNLALSADDPEVLTTADIGATVIGTMASLNAENTAAAVELMANTTFWVEEGFNPAEQPTCVERVAKWTSVSLLESGSAHGLARLHQCLGGPPQVDSLSLLGEGVKVADRIAFMGRRLAETNRAKYFEVMHQGRVRHYRSLHATPSSRMLFNELLGGAMASTFDPMAVQATKSGIPARPETLLFAEWLSANATSTAQEFQSACFNYSGQSSSAMDAFATQVQGMVKKTQAFMAMVDEYSGPNGVERLRQKVKDFLADAEGEVMKVVKKMQAKGGSSLVALPAGEASGLSLLAQPAGGDDPDALPEGTAWATMANVLHNLESVLPKVVDNLKLARNEVSAVSSTLDSIFDVFKDAGLPLFIKIAKYYRMIWITYYVLLTVFTLTILYYGFWASGYFGGPQAHDIVELTPEEKEEAEKPCSARWCGRESWMRCMKWCFCCRRRPEEPTTFWDKCKCCWGTCWAWTSDCSETQCCFWSLILLGQLFVLILFLVSLVLCIMAGIQMFIASGCASVYVLGDDQACTETLLMVRSFITTFDANAPDLPLQDVCSSTSLATCKIIEEKMKLSALLTVAGAVIVAVLTFQLLIESSILHERARMRRIIEEGLRDGTMKLPEEYENQ